MNITEKEPLCKEALFRSNYRTFMGDEGFSEQAPIVTITPSEQFFNHLADLFGVFLGELHISPVIKLAVLALM